MNEKVEKAIISAGVNVPVMKSRVVGDRVELFLYGGQVVVYPPQGMSTDAVHERVDTSLERLKRMKVVELRSIARKLGVKRVTSLRKARLITAIIEAGELNGHTG